MLHLIEDTDEHASEAEPEEGESVVGAEVGGAKEGNGGSWEDGEVPAVAEGDRDAPGARRAEALARMRQGGRVRGRMGRVRGGMGDCMGRWVSAWQGRPRGEDAT